MTGPTTLDTAGILKWCERRAIPAGVDLDAAIEAHRIGPACMSSFTIRAVILACAPDLERERQRLDYLSGLPVSAWPENAGHTADEIRRATLDGLRRSIAWQMQN